MAKKSLFALLLAAVLLLSGCSLVLRDNNVDPLQTVILVDGDIVTKGTLLSAYEYNLYMENYYQQMMASFGLTGETARSQEAVLQDTVESYITSLVTTHKAKELGFDQFTEAEKAELDAKAQSDYDSQLQQLKDSYFADTVLEGDALAAELDAYAERMGYTLDYMRASAESAKINERLNASVTDAVTVGEAEMQATLDAKVEADKTTFSDTPSSYGSRSNFGTQTYYIPAGYRTIRMIEIAKPAADEGADEAPAAEDARAEIDAFAARIAQGEAFETLTESVRELAVCEASIDVDSAVAAAAVALTEKNAVSDVIETEDAFVLVQYVDDIAERAITLDEVRDAIYTETLEAAKNAAYTAAVTEWVDAADVQLFLDRLN